VEQLSTLLHNHHLRSTTPRQAVFRALADAAEPSYLYEIIHACTNIDRTTVYRTLELYVTLGIVEIIHVGWKKRYELAEPFKPHHHHLQCTICGELIAIDTPHLEGYIETTATNYGYRLTQHHIELRGVCKTCDKRAFDQRT